MEPRKERYNNFQKNKSATKEESALAIKENSKPYKNTTDFEKQI